MKIKLPRSTRSSFKPHSIYVYKKRERERERERIHRETKTYRRGGARIQIHEQPSWRLHETIEDLVQKSPIFDIFHRKEFSASPVETRQLLFLSELFLRRVKRARQRRESERESEQTQSGRRASGHRRATRQQPVASNEFLLSSRDFKCGASARGFSCRRGNSRNTN